MKEILYFRKKTMYKVGFSKVMVDYPLLDVCMMGYGMWNNRVKSKETNLHTRAVVVQQEKKTLVFVNIEIAFITPAIQREVIVLLNKNHANLAIDGSNVMLTAQHTHSAPSGFSEYSYYNFTTPGYRKTIFDAYVKSIVDAIVSAYNKTVEASLSYKKGTFRNEIAIAWNRSLDSYNNNLEVKKKVKDTALALDRNMYLLQVNNKKGELLGTINWFGVHATSIGNDNTKVSFDNKGYASQFLEKECPNSIHIFAQGKAGDVSPHFHGVDQVKIRKKTRKTGDHLYAKQNGKKQFIKAKEIITSDSLLNVKGELKNDILFADYSKIKISPEFTKGKKNKTTSDACFGLAFFTGTPIDGKGISKALGILVGKLNKIVNKKRSNLIESQGSKETVVNASRKEMLGQGKMSVLPSFVDPAIKEMNKQEKVGAIKENTLIPVILPVQLFLLGNLAIIGLPGEITTIAGSRLEKTIKSILKEYGIKEVILSPYANSYMGYITTKEEYELQNYEGAHTVFGKWTLAAFQTKFKELCIEIGKPKEERKLDRNVKPPFFSKKELDLRSY